MRTGKERDRRGGVKGFPEGLAKVKAEEQSTLLGQLR